MKPKKDSVRAVTVIGQHRNPDKLVVRLVLVAFFSGVAGVSLAQLGRETPGDTSSATSVDAPTNVAPGLAISSNVPAPTGVSSATTVNTKIEGDYAEIGFNQLSAFPVRVVYETVDPVTLAYAPKILGEIPLTIRALDAKKVAVTGFMLPLKQADGFVTEFLLLKDQSMCCFGLSPKANEWVQVQMKGKGIRSIMDEPIIICGTLHVGEFQHNQQMAGVYRLDGDKLVKPR